MNLKPLPFLLALFHAVPVAALGLGEISVRSHLGQPLHATVDLLGASAETTAACFSIDASEDGVVPPPRAQLSIESSGERTLLHIRTPQSLSDPIVQFVVVSDCDARLRRDYVVLLDPPALISTPISQEAPVVREEAAAPPVARVKPAQRKAKPKPVAAASRPTSTARQPAAPRPQTDAAVRPRLVLSGKHRSTPAGDAPVALRLDTSLPDLARPRAARLTVTELSDENTALSRRLAHLEAQLAALQQRNTALEARRSEAFTPPPSSRPAQWPLYLLATLLLGGAVALVAWLLRRRHSPSSGLRNDTSAQSDAGRMTLSAMTAGAATEPRPFLDRMPEVLAPPRSEDTEIKEDILDQAEVFMAHGHGDLAIHLLQEHLRAAPAESPVPWLLLLDLLHREGDTAAYAAASAECRRYFNVNLTGHPISQENEVGLGLEAYPHLLEELVKVWNTPDVSAFFHDLVYDDRGGTRMGFEPGAYRDILLLRTIAQETLPLAA